MWYLFLQIWLWLLAAFALGWLAHWFFCCRNKEDKETTSTSNGNLGVAGAAASQSTEIEVSDDWKPLGFSERPNKVNDLKRIKGVGAVIETTLNELGFYQFGQIAEWSDENVAWVENFISFPGRIGRENWVMQAKTLATGGTTEFANRVDKGDVEY